MDAHNELTAQERAVLRALLQGPATGIRTVAERIACRRLSADNDMARLQESITAIRMLTAKKLIVKRQVEGGSLVLRITRQGRKAIEPERTLANFGKLALSLSAAYAVAGLAGCATQPDLPSHKPLAGMGYPTITGMGQVRDPQSGELVFVPCNPCAVPTLKTPVVIVPAEPVKAAEPEPIMMRGNLVATLAEPVAKPAAAAIPSAIPTQRVTPTVQSAAAPGHVLFASASAKLDADALAYIKRFAATAKGAAGIVVTGQTDSTGTTAGNERLALARARIVRAALIAAGIPASKIKTATCLTCFAGDNGTEEGKRINRRAEIAITKGN
ncbi:OmpA family protein [Ralstonia insidiosa]|uniref:OmpA family protein n=1 Tax=Ralstonia insidiosa TaxID=190721 RepID=A0A848P939_9RALS|nr:OmpA family protein [Ralstonia insidiosa]NMV41144.1 OmpA family protein [Ralstonia insidiosa]